MYVSLTAQLKFTCCQCSPVFPLFSGHPWYVQLRAAQDPSLHLVWPLAWRGAPAPGPAWGDRHEWSELWAVVVCRMRTEWDIIQTSVTRGHSISDIDKALSSSLENSAVPRVLWGWETSTITTHSPLLTTWPSCWRTKSSSPLSPMSSSTWRDCLMKVSYDHDASRLCITHLGIGMLLLHQSVIPDSAVTNKGLFWKTTLSNSFCFLHRLSRRHPACLSPVRDQVPRVDKEWRGLMVMRSCVLIAITTLFPPPSQADATLCHREGVYPVYSESYHSPAIMVTITPCIVLKSGHWESSCYRDTEDGKWWNGFRHPRPRHQSLT